ncbi:hypothetical protein B0H63DRAFT_560804 [Podospora didyma]|uniref:FAD-binding PCMH-type domain-containing protein n=1 Tax=Podospora didyma TaxID=330526 RepID=A0AAE0NGF3_9PEZI|nr:hypothetical protein B0H63DRAFT_560804 [Podospora didyma]
MSSTTLKTVLSLALAATVAALPPSSPKSLGWGYPGKEFTDCLKAKNVTFRVQSDPEYAALALTYNERLQYKPAVIGTPFSVQEVIDSVKCAAKCKIPIQPKSGGHSYASYSTGGRDGIFMIFLENFHDVKLDTTTNIAAVGGGVRLGNLAQGIYDQGKRALGHGTCPGVGIGGHFTHGGYGYSSRALGLAIDQIVALDVVLANGTAVHASETSHPDVYYAMRGAADAFGIVTTFYLQTSPAPEEVVNFSYSFPNALASVGSAVSALEGLQAFSLNASVVDGRLGVGLYVDSGPAFLVRGTWFGSLADFNASIAPALLSAIPSAPASITVDRTDWITSLIQLGGAPNLTVPLYGYNARDNFFAKSVTTTMAFPDNALRSFFQYIVDKGLNGKAPVSWFSIINLYGGPGSVIPTHNENFAAYSGHDDLWVIQNYGFVPQNQIYPDAGIGFINGLNDAMTDKLTEFGAYLNYVDPTYSAAESYKLYYGAELYNRLRKLKAAIDPLNLFSNPQSIR